MPLEHAPYRHQRRDIDHPMAKHTPSLNHRICRDREFYGRHDPGDLLVYINGDRSPSLESFLCTALHERGPEATLAPEAVRSAIGEYAASLRAAASAFYAIEDDSVPCAIVYWGIGGITAAMVGRDPMHDDTTSWLEPSMSWAEIDGLAFDPENRWIRNHTVGLYQVDLVSSYRGMLVQWFVDDPKHLPLASALLDHPDLREKILAASLHSPVAGRVPHDRLDEILDIVRHGRFLLSVSCPPDVPADPIIRKVRAASNID